MTLKFICPYQFQTLRNLLRKDYCLIGESVWMTGPGKTEFRPFGSKLQRDTNRK